MLQLEGRNSFFDSRHLFSRKVLKSVQRSGGRQEMKTAKDAKRREEAFLLNSQMLSKFHVFLGMKHHVSTQPGSIHAALDNYGDGRHIRYPKRLGLKVVNSIRPVDEGWRATPSMPAGVALDEGTLNKVLSTESNPFQILKVVEENQDSINEIHLVTAFHRLAKRTANCSKSLAENLRSHRMVKWLGNEVMDHLSSYDAQALANVAWAHAKLGHGPPSLMKLLVKAAMHRLHQFKPLEVSILMTALGNEETECSDLLAGLVERRVKGQLSKYRARQIKEIVWVHARHNLPSDELFRQIGEHVQARLPEFEARSLAIIAWSYARLNNDAPGMFEAIACKMVEEQPSLAPQDVANFAWAFAKLQVNEPAFLKMLASNASGSIRHYCDHSLSSTLWALATLGYHDEQLMDAAASHVILNAPRFSDQALANIAWSFASLRHFSRPLMVGVAQAVQLRLHSLDTSFLVTFLYTFATFGFRNGLLLSSVSEEFARRLQEGEIPRQSLVLLAWSLAVLRWYPPSFIPQLREQLAAIPDFTSQQLCQLFQVELALRLESPQMGQVAGSWAPDSSAVEYLNSLWIAGHLREQAKTCWDRENALDRRQVSSFQAQIAASLESLGIDHKVEHMEGDYSIDIALLLEGGALKVAVEADGPSHFASNHKRRALGATILKARMLKRLGWTVVQVPYFHWTKLNNATSREAYLRKRFASHGVVHLYGQAHLSGGAAEAEKELGMGEQMVSSTACNVRTGGTASSSGHRQGGTSLRKVKESHSRGDAVNDDYSDEGHADMVSFSPVDDSAKGLPSVGDEGLRGGGGTSAIEVPLEAAEVERQAVAERAERLNALKAGRGGSVNKLAMLREAAVRRRVVKQPPADTEPEI